MRRPAALAVAGAAAVAALVAGSTVAAPAPASAELCIPILMPCPDPGSSPTPTPSPTRTTTSPGGLLDPIVPGKGDPVLPTAPAPAPSSSPSTPPEDDGSSLPLPDDDTAVFTQPPAQLGAKSLSFTGLEGVALVKVRLANGRRVPALRLSAESITITGFALTVRAETGPTLATTADTMTLRGHVRVYVDSLTGTTSDGRSYTLGADTPPPKDGIEPGMLRVTLGLVGTLADSIVYTNTDQRLTD
jgi:hypothetical protein